MSWEVSETAGPHLSRKSAETRWLTGGDIFGLISLFFITKLQGDPGDHILFGWLVGLHDVLVGMSTVASDGRLHQNQI